MAAILSRGGPAGRPPPGGIGSRVEVTSGPDERRATHDGRHDPTRADREDRVARSRLPGEVPGVHAHRLARRRAGRHPAPRPRRATPSAAPRCPPPFPGETLVIPTGTEKTRANDTDYPFRPGSDFAYLTGDHDADSVLVMQPERRRPRRDRSTPGPRSSRETDEFFRSRDGELWVGRRHDARREGRRAGRCETAALADLEKALADAARRGAPGCCAGSTRRSTRPVRPWNDKDEKDEKSKDRRSRDARAGRRDLRAEAGQGRVGDRPAPGRDRRDRPRLRGRRPDPAGRPGRPGAADRGRLRAAGPARRQRRRLQLDRRRRRARDDPALDPQRRRDPAGRAAADGHGRGEPRTSTPPT